MIVSKISIFERPGVASSLSIAETRRGSHAAYGKLQRKIEGGIYITNVHR